VRGCRLFHFLSFADGLFPFFLLLFRNRGSQRAVWLMLSPRGLAHAFTAQSGSCFRCAPCFYGGSCSSSRRMLLSRSFCFCLSPVASSPRSHTLSSSASPVLLCFLVSSVFGQRRRLFVSNRFKSQRTSWSRHKGGMENIFSPQDLTIKQHSLNHT
jgi:hypothetical protein